MTHTVMLKVGRIFKVYIEDKNYDLTDAEIVGLAKQRVLEDIDTNAILVPELGVEEQDILEAYFVREEEGV